MKTLLAFLLALPIAAQITVTTETNVVMAAASGGQSKLTKTSATMAISYACTGTSGESTGTYKPSPAPARGQQIIGSDALTCQVILNPTATDWAVFGGSFTVPAQSIGIACVATAATGAAATAVVR
jgi:hypothetical protein